MRPNGAGDEAWPLTLDYDREPVPSSTVKMADDARPAGPTPQTTVSLVLSTAEAEQNLAAIQA